MKILVVCQYYHPEPFRIHEVCEALVQRGHSVTVLTGRPNYPMGEIPKEYLGKEHMDEVVNGVHIIRVKETPRSPGKVGLARNYASYMMRGCMKALFMRKDYDVVFVYQLSPILMAIPAFVVRHFSRCKKIALYCLDLWPESLCSLGISTDSAFYKVIRRLSINIYNKVDALGYTSRMFRSYFEDNLKLRQQNYLHIPQFADDLFTGVESEDHEGMNFVFAGNIGNMQSVGTIVRAASYCTRDDVKWHIVGDGFDLEECMRLAKELKVEDRVIFYGRRPVEDMPGFYSIADAMIVTLADNAMISYTLPGKIQSYMAAGKAVLACANGEIDYVVNDAKCGICVPAENAKALAEAAMSLTKESCERYGRAARLYYDRNYSKDEHIEGIVKLLEM